MLRELSSVIIMALTLNMATNLMMLQEKARPQCYLEPRRGKEHGTTIQ